ncbi:MAG: accessory gene regulator B family protein [Lachnospiraceae bacterium]|nr:accessory gene regulator B family protein [Lachnospiraceae bacterium]
MIENIVKAVVDYQVKNEILKEQDESVYQYGYTLLFERAINIFISLIICIITHKWIETALLLFCIIPLRSYAGGWHAKKFISCTIISNLIIVVGVYSKWLNKMSVGIYAFLELLICAIIMYIAPVQNQNKILSYAEKIKYKKNSILIFLFEFIILVVFLYKNIEYKYIVIFSQLIVSVGLLIGAVDDRHECYK